MAVSFEGRQLSPAQQKRIADVIMENSSIQITGIMEAGALQEERAKARTEGSSDKGGCRRARANAQSARQDIGQSLPMGEGNADFYKGNLRSGQILESETNITLIGDVNPGANIISGGSIVILGSLKGNACAGASGDGSCFIFALDMRPIQLQIGELSPRARIGTRSPDACAGRRRTGRERPKWRWCGMAISASSPWRKGFWTACNGKKRGRRPLFAGDFAAGRSFIRKN